MFEVCCLLVIFIIIIGVILDFLFWGYVFGRGRKEEHHHHYHYDKPSKSGGSYCSKCGASIDLGDKFCPKCGKRV